MELSVHPEQKKIFQAMSPSQKLQAALRLYYSAKHLKMAGLRKQYPMWSEEKIAEKVRELFLYAR
jgi:hypothetical protein